MKTCASSSIEHTTGLLQMRKAMCALVGGVFIVNTGSCDCALQSVNKV